MTTEGVKMQLEEKIKLARYAKNYAYLDTVRSMLQRLEFESQNDSDAVEAIAGMVGGLIASTMKEGDHVTTANNSEVLGFYPSHIEKMINDHYETKEG